MTNGEKELFVDLHFIEHVLPNITTPNAQEALLKDIERFPHEYFNACRERALAEYEQHGLLLLIKPKYHFLIAVIIYLLFPIIVPTSAIPSFLIFMRPHYRHVDSIMQKIYRKNKERAYFEELIAGMNFHEKPIDNLEEQIDTQIGKMLNRDNNPSSNEYRTILFEFFSLFDPSDGQNEEQKIAALETVKSRAISMGIQIAARPETAKQEPAGPEYPMPQSPGVPYARGPLVLSPLNPINNEYK